MSEFKFACPICGQHITADSAGAGSQLECPTCYRKIVVPQAPTSTDPKFILSAAEANKPRPPQSLPTLEPIANQPVRTAIPIAAIIVLILLFLAGATLFVFRGEIFHHKRTSPSQMAGSSDSEINEDHQPSAKKIARLPPPTNSIAWNLELTEAGFPETAAAGKLRGEFVSCNRNALNGGALSFRQATRGLPDLSVTINFFAKQPDELRGKSITIATNDTPAPRVTLRWREGKENKNQSFNNGYALKLELGDIVGNRITGKVYLSLPDEAQSRIAGNFTADVKKAAPPKPRAPKPK